MSGAVIVVLLAKAPQPGQVKTRLIPLLGEEGAAALHCALLERTLRTSLDARCGSVELSCAPASDHPYFVRCAKRFDVALSEQGSGDLGERMLDAARRALTRAEAVILLGSDCAALGVQDLREASSVLAEGRDAVLGPVEDGGYYLLGLRRPAAELFDGIEWSTSTVLGETRRRLAALRWHCHELPTRWDVDRPDDYRRMQQKGLLPAGTVRASFQ